MVFSEKIGEGFVEITTNMRGFTNQINGAVAKMRAAGQKMQAIGTKMTAGVTLPIVGAGTAAGKMASDFEESMQRMVSLVGLSQGQVNGFKEDVQDLADETSRAPKELADAMFFITSAGLRGGNALGVLEASAKAAAAGMGNTRTVADAATSAMNAYGQANLNATDAVSVLVSTVREGKVETSELAGVVGRVVPLASQLGVSFEEVGASLASMTRIGLDAAESATALRGIFRALIKPSEQAKDTLQEFGLSVDGLRRQVEQGNIIDVLLRLKETFGDNEEALSNVFPRVRGLIGVLSLVGKNADKAEQTFRELGNTTGSALTNAFGATQQTNAFKLAKALTNVKNAFIDFGRALLPVVVPLLQDLAGFIREMADRFSNMTQEVKESIITWLGALAGIGPALATAGTLLTGLASTFEALGSVFSIQGAAITAMLSSIVAAVKDFWNPSQSIFKNFKRLWENVVNKFTGEGSVMGGTIEELTTLATKLGQTFLKVGNNINKFLGAFDKEVINGFANALETVLELINEVVEGWQKFIQLRQLASPETIKKSLKQEEDFLKMQNIDKEIFERTQNRSPGDVILEKQKVGKVLAEGQASTRRRVNA